MEKELIEKLEKMPTQVLRELSDIRIKKRESVQRMRFEDALDFRTKEREILIKYGIPGNAKFDTDIFTFMRDRKLGILTDENIQDR